MVSSCLFPLFVSRLVSAKWSSDIRAISGESGPKSQTILQPSLSLSLSLSHFGVFLHTQKCGEMMHYFTGQQKVVAFLQNITQRVLYSKTSVTC